MLHETLIGRRICLALLVSRFEYAIASQTNVSFPSSHSGTGKPVLSNFFGISIELSIINTLIGNSTSSIPPQIENYLSYIQARANNSLRVRVGGNSMDDSVYNASQSEMIVNMGQALSVHDQPVSYGPVFYDVLAEIAKSIGGAQYLIGLSLILREENDTPLIVSTAKEKLGDSLDGFLLGNEPDLYGPHGKRQDNYSIQDYFGEFDVVSRQLNSSSQYGDLIPGTYLGGPTICCNWGLMDILNQGYLSKFDAEMKYVNLQHYPKTNCFGSSETIAYYTSHSNVVSLAQWQLDGIGAAEAAGKPVLMGEFNTASCGGIPGVSDTFAATLWTIDYALQLATVGYEGAFIHTRERGVTYNLFDPPAANDSSTNWTTLPSYYALLSTTEAFSGGSQNGSYVMDLKLNNNSNTSTTAGYGIYDGKTGEANRLVFLNYADAGNDIATFSTTSNGNSVAYMRILTAANLYEKYNISWAGKTFKGVGNGIMVDSGLAPDQQIQCGSTCKFQVPPPGVAVVWFNSSSVPVESDPGSPLPSTSHVTFQAGSSSVCSCSLVSLASLAVVMFLL